MPPWSDDIWTDVARMRTLNMEQSRRQQEMHLCPLQFDICDRVIEQFTMPGETVLDPFAGIMSVPYRALLKNRQGIGIELSPRYFWDGCNYLKSAENKTATPSLFDLVDTEAAA